MEDMKVSFNPAEMIREGFSVLESMKDGSRYAGIFQYIIEEKLDILSILAESKMEDSIRLNEVLSHDLLASELFIALSTFPWTIDEARSRNYPNGYVKHLEDIYSIAKAMNPSAHFFHIQFFKEELSFEIQISFWPEKKLLPFVPNYFLPSELLTHEEELKLGLIESRNGINGGSSDPQTKRLKRLWMKIRHLSLDTYYRLIGFERDAEM